MKVTLEKAKDTIAEAAERARHEIASEADAARKFKFTQDNSDHDIIVELRVRMEDLKNAIQTLTDGTAKKIDDHEKRLLDLEGSKTYTSVMLTVGSALLVILSGLLFFHIFGMK
jgi:hypothetical protein